MGDKWPDPCMKTTNKEVAILVFARAVHNEILEKHLFGLDAGKNIKLFAALNHTIKQTVIFPLTREQ